MVIVDIQEELGRNVAVSIGKERASFYRCDITEETQVENAVKFTVEKHGKLDVLFSNAGILDPRGSILDLDLDRFDRIMAVNVRGACDGGERHAWVYRVYDECLVGDWWRETSRVHGV